MNPDNQDCILDLKALSARGGLSIRSLRLFLKPDHPQFLRHYKMAGKILVHWKDYLEWLKYFEVKGIFKEQVDSIVIEIRERNIRHQSKQIK